MSFARLWTSIITFKLHAAIIKLSLGYKLWISIQKSVVKGKFEIAGLLFLATETRPHVTKGLQFFKDSLPYSMDQVGGKFYIFVDKVTFKYLEILSGFNFYWVSNKQVKI